VQYEDNLKGRFFFRLSNAIMVAYGKTISGLMPYSALQHHTREPIRLLSADNDCSRRQRCLSVEATHSLCVNINAPHVFVRLNLLLCILQHKNNKNGLHHGTS